MSSFALSSQASEAAQEQQGSLCGKALGNSLSVLPMSLLTVHDMSVADKQSNNITCLVVMMDPVIGNMTGKAGNASEPINLTSNTHRL